MVGSLDLHAFFMPFLAPGHMIPMVDLARIFAGRGVKVTIVTTVGNAPLIQPTIDSSPRLAIQLLTLPLPFSVENLMGLPTPEPTPDFIAAMDSLKDPFQALVDRHRPDFVVSDVYYLWTADLGVTRLGFHGSCAFSSVVGGAISASLKPHETATDEAEPFAVPGMPHHIELTRSQLMPMLAEPDERGIRIYQSLQRSYGMIFNTVYGLEPEYVSMMSDKAWHVGPVSLSNRETVEMAVRGGGSRDEHSERCLDWLAGKKPGSVLFVSFGSLGRFTSSQLREIAQGLVASGHPFMWAIKHCGDEAEWMPEGLEGGGDGLIVAGWAPQMLILNLEAVGGFLTHCGWNSCLEGASAGLPMITWPLFAEQFFNEKLLVSVLRVGVSVGAKVCSTNEAARTFVRSGEVMRAAMDVMGGGEEADARRERARVAAETARKAVEEGGSSYNDISRLIQEMVDVKAGRLKVNEQRESLGEDSNHFPASK